MFENEIDIEKLRQYLIDHLGSGMITLSHPGPGIHNAGIIAMGYLGEVETADPDRLIELASELEII